MQPISTENLRSGSSECDQTKIPSLHFADFSINDNTASKQSVECIFHTVRTQKERSTRINRSNSAIRSVSHAHCSPVTSIAVHNRFSPLADTQC